MGNSTARDKSRIQAEGESESGATIEAPPTDVGVSRDVSFRLQELSSVATLDTIVCTIMG